MSLKQQARAGLFWTFLQQFGTQLISFVVGIVLARLLIPSDFGAIAMLGVVIAISTSIIDGGMTSSLIRTQDADEKDYSTIFWFNILVSFLMYIVIYITAPLVANFYELNILTSIIRVYSLTIVINSFASVQVTKFTKEMDFKTLFKIRLPSLIIGGIVGIVLALYGFGIWSLVFYPIVQSIIVTIQFWFYSKWTPRVIFDKKKFFYHFNFGYRMTLSSLLDTLFNNAYTIIIGKMFSTTQLGYYNRADVLKQLPVANLSAVLNSVTFPLFAKISDNNEKLKEVYQKLLKVVIFIIAPVLSVMVVIAEPLIRFLLTDQWLPSVPYLQILAIAGVLYPIHAYNLNVLKVKGRSDLFLKLEILKKVLITIVIIVSLQFGLMGLVWGQVVISVLAFFINTHYTGKIIHYGAFKQIKDLVPTIILSTVTAFLFYQIDDLFLQTTIDFIRILTISTGFFLVFLGTAWLLKFDELKYIKELLRK